MKEFVQSNHNLGLNLVDNEIDSVLDISCVTRLQQLM